MGKHRIMSTCLDSYRTHAQPWSTLLNHKAHYSPTEHIDMNDGAHCSTMEHIAQPWSTLLNHGTHYLTIEHSAKPYSILLKHGADRARPPQLVIF